MQCYKHPREETFVSCGKCDRPICPKCMVQGPAGIRCRECASLRSTSLYKVHPGRLLLAAVAGLVVGVFGAGILSIFSFYVIFAAPVYGGLVAEPVSRASGRKQGPALNGIGIGSIVIGHLIVILPEIFFFTRGPAIAGQPGVTPTVLAQMNAGIGMMVGLRLVSMVLAIGGCVARMRYV